MTVASRTTTAVSLVVLAVIGFGVYWPGLHTPYYADDFQFYFDPPPPGVFHYFTHPNVHNPMAYRPLQATFLTMVQQSAGQDTLPIHVVQISLHVVLSWLVFVWMTARGLGRWAAASGALFMLVSQAGAHAVLSNDTLSQVCTPLFGGLSLWLLHRADDAARGNTNRTCLVLSVLAFALALLSKETSTSFFVMALAVIVITSARFESRRSRIRHVLAWAAPYLVVLAVYFGVRFQLDASRFEFGSERYDLRLGPNVVRNFAMFAFQALLPTSSVNAYSALQQRDLASLSAAAIGTLVFAGAVAFGLRDSGRRGLCVLLGLFAVLGLFPMVLMNQVSELYLYNSMPFVAILVGTGVGALMERARTHRVRRLACVAGLALVLLANIAAVRSKASLMNHAGERAAVLLARIQPHLAQVPDHATLLLANPPSDQVEYSIFLMNGFNVLNSGLFRLNQLAGHREFEVKIVTRSQLEEAPPPTEALALTLDPDTGAVLPLARP